MLGEAATQPGSRSTIWASERSARITDCFAQKRRWTGEVDVQGPTGRRIQAVTVTPVFEEDLLARVVVIRWDLTDLRAAESVAAHSERLASLGTLAAGLAHEINNPLMFASGHLQLLKAQLHPRDDADRCSQVDAALDGLGRIQGAVERLRLLSQAADGPTADDRVDLGALISHAVRARASGAATAAVEIEPGEHAVQGDLAQLTLAVAAVVEFADEIAAVVSHCQLTLGATEGAYRLRLLARGQGLATWQLPNTFEPFYPQRLIRGQSHGLGLFLAQTVVHGHRGQATARRQADGGLQLDFLLPK